MIAKIIWTLFALATLCLFYDDVVWCLKYTWKIIPVWRKCIICVSIFAYISLLTVCVIKLWMV